jgi:hypothetical protein
MKVRVLAALAAVSLLTACAGDDEDGADAAPTAAAGGGGSAAVDDYDNRFNLIAMAHTSPGTARGLPIEVDTQPWDGTSTGGPFSFASAPCSADAPINNVSTNLTSLNTQLEGSRSPASTRLHPLEFEILSLQDGAGELRGTIDLTACQPRFGVTPPDDPTADADRDRIRFEFTGSFEQPTPEETTWFGEFRIVDGTGPYQGIEGSGQISGYFMCLGPDRCEQQGEFRDSQVAMIGSYEMP